MDDGSPTNAFHSTMNADFRFTVPPGSDIFSATAPDQYMEVTNVSTSASRVRNLGDTPAVLCRARMKRSRPAAGRSGAGGDARVSDLKTPCRAA